MGIDLMSSGRGKETMRKQRNKDNKVYTRERERANILDVHSKMKTFDRPHPHRWCEA